MSIHTIQTGQGRYFDLENPDPKDVLIQDIASGLAKTARFNGHTFGFLSVAQHCVNVEAYLKEQGHGVRVRLAGLLHDASEAYVHDVSAPLKDLLPGYRAIEKKVTRAILIGLGLCFTEDDMKIVKKADHTMLLTEKRDFKVKGMGKFNKKFCCVDKPWKRKLKSMGWRQAEHLFLAQYYNLRAKL